MKRGLAMMATGVLAAAALAACGSSSDKSGNGGSSGGSSSGKVIKIGASMPLTGPYANTSFEAGIKQAVADINTSGGVQVGSKKDKLELVVQDNQSQNTLMEQQMRNLVLKDGVVAELGPPSPQNQDAAPIANLIKVPTVFYAAIAESMPKGAGGWWWSSSLSVVAQDLQQFKFMAAAHVPKTVMIVAGNDPQSKSFIASEVAMSHKFGYKIVAQAQVPLGQNDDFSNVINQAKAGKAAVVSTLMSPPDCIALLKQMRALGYKPYVIEAGLCGISPAFPQLGSLTNGSSAASLWSPKAAGDKPSPAQMEKEFASQPNLYGVQDAVTAYQAVQIIAGAITKAGSTSPSAINAAMPKVQGAFASGAVKFNADHESNLPSYQTQWQGNDAIVTYPPSAANGKFKAPVPGLQ